MADTLDSGKRRRSSGFRSAQSRGTGPTGPGGSTRPAAGRPKRGPSGSTRPSSGASVGSTATNVPVRGGGLPARNVAGDERLGHNWNQQSGLSAEQDARFKQLEAEATAAESAKRANTPTAADDADEARAQAEKNQEWARQRTRPAYDSEKEAKAMRDEALKSAPNASRPLTDADRKNFSSADERAAAGKAKPAAAGSQSRLSAFNSNVKRNRSKFIAGGGIAGLFMVVIISFLGLLPLKLESMIKNMLENRITNRVNHYMDRRYQRLVDRYLISSVGVGTAGADDAAFERNIINYGQPIRDFYRTWRVNTFEAKLQAHQGIRLQRTAGGGIDVYKDGKFVGSYAGAEARAYLKNAVYSETKAYQVILRHHLLKWQYYAYNVRRFGDWFRNLRNSKSAPGATDDEVAADSIDDAAGPVADQTSKIVECALSLGADGKCVTDPNNPDVADQEAKVDTHPTTTDGAGIPDVQNAISDSETTAADKAKQYLHTIAQNVGNPNVKTDKLFGRILTKFLDEAVAKDILAIVGAAKGPLIIIELVDIASQIDHFFYNGGADKVVTASHEVEYAHQFASWASKTDEWKDGTTISGDEFNSAQKPIQDVQKSQSFQYLYLNNTSGQPLTTVDDGNGGTKSDSFARGINEKDPVIQNYYRIVFGDFPSSFEPGMTNHQFFDAWYITGHKVWAAINAVIGLLLSFVFHILEDLFPPLRTAWDWLTSHLSDWIIKLILWLVRPAVEGTERNADLFNGLYAGATVNGLGFSRNLGAPKIARVNAIQLDSEIAKANAQAASHLSIRDRIFSTDYNHSLVNTLAVAAPTTPSEVMNDSLGYFASLTQNPFRTFEPLLRVLGIGNAHAAGTGDGPDNLFGMYDWGYTDAQLGADDAVALQQACQNTAQRLGKDPNSCGGTASLGDSNPAASNIAEGDSSAANGSVLAATTPDNAVHLDDMNLGDCPKVADPTTQPNVCRLDIATMQALGSNSTGNDNGGLNAPGGAP